MTIYITRHGQTRLNHEKIMQGRIDEPLNATGLAQAAAAAELVRDVHFDAVYSSPLQRARTTACMIAGVDEAALHIDGRIIEVDFGRYERRGYHHLGLAMSAYWAWPEIFPAPRTVESVKSMCARTSEFLRELEQQDYENVLIVCHGGIIRALCGYLEDRRSGIRWRPRPRNCEIRVYESVGGVHRFLRSLEPQNIQ